MFVFKLCEINKFISGCRVISTDPVQLYTTWLEKKIRDGQVDTSISSQKYSDELAMYVKGWSSYGVSAKCRRAKPNARLEK